MKIFRWSLKDERLWLFLWSAGIFGIVCFVISLYPLIGDMMSSLINKDLIIMIFGGRYAPLLKDRSYFDLWLSMEFFGWFGALAGVYPMIFASGSISAEAGRGALEMVLAQPVSRTRVLVEKFLALQVCLLVICAAAFAALVGSAAIWVDEPAYRTAYAWIMLNNYFLLFCLSAFAFLAAVMIDDQRTVLSVTIGAAISSYIVNRTLTSLGVAEWAARLTPFFYADSTGTLATGRPAFADNLVLVVAGLALLGLAIVMFNRKDLAGN